MCRIKKCQSVVFKIDAEGYEKVIIKEISAALPPELPFALIFENWKEDPELPKYISETTARSGRLWLVNDTLSGLSSPLKRVLSALIWGRRVTLIDSKKWVGMNVFISDCRP